MIITPQQFEALHALGIVAHSMDATDVEQAELFSTDGTKGVTK